MTAPFTYLAKKNPCPWDDDISMNKRIYHIRGLTRKPISVTELLNTVAPKFPQTSIISRMTEKPCEPKRNSLGSYNYNPQYPEAFMIPPLFYSKPYSTRLRQRVEAFVEEHEPEWTHEQKQRCAELLFTSTNNFRVYRDGLLWKQLPTILAETWQENAKTSSTKGTQLHYYIEGIMNQAWTDNKGMKDPDQEACVQQVRDFFRDHAHWEIYRSEVMVFDRVHEISGTIDAVFKDPEHDGMFVLVDWKRAKDKLAVTSKGKKCRAPLAGWPGSSLARYELQLNLYRILFEQLSQASVSGMFVVQFHENNPRHYPTTRTSYQKFNVARNDLQPRILLKHRLAQLQSDTTTSVDETQSNIIRSTSSTKRTPERSSSPWYGLGPAKRSRTKGPEDGLPSGARLSSLFRGVRDKR